MRIAIITAGTGSFHCGSCMRDNALATELVRQGHDAVLVPLYLPLVLDETPAPSTTPIFYGGVNVYLQQISRLFRKTPRWLDRLLDMPRVLGAAAKRAGMTSASDLGEVTLSTLRGEEGNQAKELDRLVDWLATEFKPDAVILSYALLIGMVKRMKQSTNARVYCTLQGEDTFLDGLPEPHRTQCWETIAERATDVDGFIPVSYYHGELMTQGCRLDSRKVHVVHNGISLAGYPTEPRNQMPEPPVIGYLARMYPGKGLETLVDAYLQIRQRGRVPGVRLLVIGSRNEADLPFSQNMMERLRAENVEVAEGWDHFQTGMEAVFLPNARHEEKLMALQSMSVLSTPATYGESFGLYVIEAMAAGVPVVQPDCAAFPEIIQSTGGGILVRPDDVGALADGLEQLLLDPAGSLAMGERGRLAVRERFNIEAMAQGVLSIITSTVTQPTSQLDQ